MATPPGPPSPGNFIDFDTLRSQPNITPNADISLYLLGTYVYSDGFLDDYTFFYTYYPIPSSPAGGGLTQDLSISYFYDIDSETGTDCNWSGALTWVTDVNVDVTNSTNLSSGSNVGPNQFPSPYTIASFGGTMGTIGNNIPHWQSMDVQVTIFGNKPPSPPNPPSPDVNIEYDIGGGWTAFPGSPFTMGGPYTANLLGVPNGQILYVRVY